MASKAGQSLTKNLNKIFRNKVNSESVKVMKNMNMAIYEDELRELRSKGLVDFMFVFLSIFSGAVCMVFIEDWSFLNSFYWACVTVGFLLPYLIFVDEQLLFQITTVGYGDVSPKSDGGKIFTIFYTIIACSFAATGFRALVS